MTVSAHDVARELRRRLGSRVGDTKIHKLLYYCQGWHLVRHDAPIFEERVEGWPDGPVIADVWHAERHDHRIPEPSPLDENALDTIAFVVARYGDITGGDLIEITHSEAPWDSVRDQARRRENPVIPAETLVAFFSKIDDLYSLRSPQMTDQRRRIIEEAKARANR